jgi:hypothetical protein
VKSPTRAWWIAMLLACFISNWEPHRPPHVQRRRASHVAHHRKHERKKLPWPAT